MVLSAKTIGQRLRGGQNVSHEFWGGGERTVGGGTYCRVCSPKPLLEASEIGSGRCLFLLREMTESRQKERVKKVSWVGGPKRFWGGVFRRIYGMFSTPLSFPPPLAAL